MSHIDLKINTIILKAIANNFGGLFITRLGEHTLLGMDIKLLDNNRLEIGTNSYIQEGVRGFDEEVYTKVSSPENKNLRKVNLDSPILPKEQAEDFYSVVENLLWTTKLA